MRASMETGKTHEETLNRFSWDPTLGVGMEAGMRERCVLIFLKAGTWRQQASSWGLPKEARRCESEATKEGKNVNRNV